MAGQKKTQLHPDLRKQLVDGLGVHDSAVDAVEALLRKGEVTGDQIADAICDSGFDGDLDEVFDAIIDHGISFEMHPLM